MSSAGETDDPTSGGSADTDDPEKVDAMILSAIVRTIGTVLKAIFDGSTNDTLTLLDGSHEPIRDEPDAESSARR